MQWEIQGNSVIFLNLLLINIKLDYCGNITRRYITSLSIIYQVCYLNILLTMSYEIYFEYNCNAKTLYGTTKWFNSHLLKNKPVVTL